MFYKTCRPTALHEKDDTNKTWTLDMRPFHRAMHAVAISTILQLNCVDNSCRHVESELTIQTWLTLVSVLTFKLPEFNLNSNDGEVYSIT